MLYPAPLGKQCKSKAPPYPQKTLFINDQGGLTMTDKGLKKAVGQQAGFKLPSNFSYRTMKRIEEKAYLKEKREEKRIFISWLITISLMLASGIGYFGWSYHEQFTALFHRAKDSVPDAKTLLLCLPTAIALLLLFFFNNWLRKRIRQKTGNQ